MREHLEPFLAYTREHYRKPLPKYVERELRGLLRCGDPWHGFTRVRCPRCRHEFFVAFSCGARTVCPSCSGRRMAAASVHLIGEASHESNEGGRSAVGQHRSNGHASPLRGLISCQGTMGAMRRYHGRNHRTQGARGAGLNWVRTGDCPGVGLGRRR